MWAVMCVCRHVCHTQAWSCLSTRWALNRCFAWFFGTAAGRAGEGAGHGPGRPGGGGWAGGQAGKRAVQGGAPCAVRAPCQKSAVFHRR